MVYTQVLEKADELTGKVGVSFLDIIVSAIIPDAGTCAPRNSTRHDLKFFEALTRQETAAVE